MIFLQLFSNSRSSGHSMLHKRAKVEFYPLGVIGAIVSWNYPFHNVFNPMLAAVFSGNAAVIKVYYLIRMLLLLHDVKLPCRTVYLNIFQKFFSYHGLSYNVCKVCFAFKG